jgi:hypothetical protein
MTTPIPSFLVSQIDDDVLAIDDDIPLAQKSLKRKRVDSDADTILLPPPPTTSSVLLESSPLYRHYAHVCAVNINETILENAEICGTNLAVKLMQLGADNILEEIRGKITILSSQQ